MYEITLFTYYEKSVEDIITEYKEKNISNNYYEIIACRLLELLPKSHLKVVCIHSNKDNIREDDRFYLHEYDTVGALVKNQQPVDTCMLVTNLETKEYFFVDYQDGPIHCMNFIQNEKCIAIYIPQHKHIYQYLDTSNLFNFSEKCHPLCFFPSSPNTTESYRDKILNIRFNDKLIPKMFFSGNFYNGYTYHNPRKNILENNRAVVEVLVNKYPEWIDTNSTGDERKLLSQEEYYTTVASYAVPLAMPGHPWSHREHEFWSMGIPTLSNTYTCSLLQPLLPNIHYIAAGTTGKDVRDREVDVEKAADLIFKRFKEVYLNRDYLNWITENTIKRYDNFSNPIRLAEHLLYHIKLISNF